MTTSSVRVSRGTGPPASLAARVPTLCAAHSAAQTHPAERPTRIRLVWFAWVTTGSYNPWAPRHASPRRVGITRPGAGASMSGTPHLDPVAFGDLLRRQRLAAGLTQEALAERAGLSVRGISDLERGIHAHPQRETVRMLAEALGVDGPARAALLAATQRPPVVDRRQPDGPPATDLLGSPTARLPVFPGSFVGRQRELAACRALLTEDGVPLLTLTGPGGTGKTRLAVAIATAVGEAFPHGVSFIDLAPLRETRQVLPQMASSLGVQERGDEPVRETLARVLAGKQLLLVLDNCEHLLGASPEIAALIAACPDLTVLATSREPLRVRSEQVFPVPPLPLPRGTEIAWADLLGVPTVALFVERARAGDPAFLITEQNTATIAAICQRLDGLPLAIELAAARIRAFPSPVLLTRLERRLP